jgi:hypothetical protein
MKNNKKLDLKCLELYKNKLIDVEKNIGSRYKFLISEIIVLINKKLNKKQEHKYIFDYNYLINKLDSNKNKFNNYLYDKFLFKLKEIEKDLNSNNFIKNYKCFLDNLLIDCFEIKIKNERLEWYKLFKELTKIIVEHKIIYEEVINEITEYIDDITLDIPDIIDKLKEFNEFKIY